MKIFIAVIISGGLALNSAYSAPVIYSYQGALFTKISDAFRAPCIPSAPSCDIDAIAGEFRFSEPLAPLLSNIDVMPASWWMTDGWTIAMPGLDSWELTESRFTTDSDGNIVGWSIEVRLEDFRDYFVGDGNMMFTARSQAAATDASWYCQTTGSTGFCGVSAPVQTIPAAEGTWTKTVIPIPAAAWLFGSALGLLGCVHCRAAQQKG